MVTRRRAHGRLAGLPLAQVRREIQGARDRPRRCGRNRHGRSFGTAKLPRPPTSRHRRNRPSATPMLVVARGDPERPRRKRRMSASSGTRGIATTRLLPASLHCDPRSHDGTRIWRRSASVGSVREHRRRRSREHIRRLERRLSILSEAPRAFAEATPDYERVLVVVPEKWPRRSRTTAPSDALERRKRSDTGPRPGRARSTPRARRRRCGLPRARPRSTCSRSRSHPSPRHEGGWVPRPR